MTESNTGRSFLLILLTIFFISEIFFPFLIGEDIQGSLIKTLIVGFPLLFQLKGHKWSFWVGGVLLFLNGAIDILLGFELENISLFVLGLFNFIYAISPIISKEIRKLTNQPTTRIKSETDNIIYPYLITRYKAAIIDGIILFSVFTLLMLCLPSSGSARSTGFIFYLMFIGLYEPSMIYFFAGTIGHQFLNIEVKQFISPDKKLTFISALIRSLFKLLLGWISFLTIGFNEEHRALHDIIGSSIVLYKK